MGKDTGLHVETRQEWGKAWGGMQALVSRCKVLLVCSNANVVFGVGGEGEAKAHEEWLGWRHWQLACVRVRLWQEQSHGVMLGGSVAAVRADECLRSTCSGGEGAV